MASYTDQISTFNPYIQQLPTDAMMQVGMQKQAQYNQGVQKIQSYIDNIAGMDVLRGTDKEYLQSKLNELGSNLKSVAAGDFSNQQLVNSVGGMATNIVKDPRVQTAVASTQKAKSELATANALYKEGKSSLRNLNYLNDQVNAYANSTDPNQPFTGKYVNYIDLNKKFMDLADNLKKGAGEGISKDNPYMTDNSGKTIYFKKDKTGKVVSSSVDPNSGGIPELDEAMKRITIKGVSAQTMYDSMKASLTGDDMEQMKIDAWDHYKGQGPESVLGDLATSNELAKQMLQQGIQKLSIDLIDPKLTSDEKLAIQSDINKYQDKLTNGSFDKEFANQIEALKNPANLQKAQLDAYYRKTLNSQATILSNQSYKEELLANPYEQANHNRAVLQESIREHNMTNQVARANIALSYKRLEKEDRWKSLENDWKTKDWQDKHPGIVVEDRAIATNIVAPTIGSLDSNIAQIEEDKTKLNNDYGGVLGLGTSGLNELYKRYRKDPTSITGNNALKYVQRRDYFERQAMLKQNVKDIVEQGTKVYDEKLDAELGKIKGIIDNTGKPLFSAKQLYDIDNLLNKYYEVKTMAAGVGGVSTTTSFNEAAFRKSLGNDPKSIAIANALVKRIKGESLTPTERIIADKMTDVHRQLDPKVQAIQKDKFDYEAKTISKYDPFYQEQVGTINTENKSDMVMLDNLIGNTITKLNSGEGVDLPPGAKLDANSLAKMRSTSADSKVKVVPTIIKRSDGSAIVVLQQGDNVQTIPVSASNFAKYYPNYAKSNPYNEDYHAVAASKYHTTNIGGGPGNTPQDAVNAAHSGHEVPLLVGTPWASKVRYDIIGDPDNTGDASADRYAIRLFVNNKGVWIPGETQGGYRNATSIQSFIENDLGTNTIESFLKIHK
jgi:hypothetical protein